MKLNRVARGGLILLALIQSACNGGETDGGGGAGGEGPTKLEVECETDAECQDGVYCNGEETCDEGQCRYGARITCGDSVECTIDRCDEAKQECVSSGPDKDGDGHLDASCLGKNDVPLGDDCDDGDDLRFPGATEICDPDQRDEDCDPATLGFRDSDNDDYIDALCCNEQNDGKLKCGEDCDDFKTNVNPKATETCDFFDNNCDGEVDEGKGVSVELYGDNDHDGHGAGKKTKTCPGAVGFAGDNTDCNDDDPEVFLGQFEICDGKDNNCDPERLADEIEEQAPWFIDADKDTYGDPTSVAVWSCYRVEGHVLSHNDCNDSEKKVNPNATEICDALDNDCNGLADYRLSGVNNFEDDDQDGSPDAACKGPMPNDCDDRDPRTSGGAIEVCDHADNDCDGETDEQTSQNIWYIDEDGDGWGVVIGSALASCDPLPARARQFGDCDDDKSSDTANSTHPGSLEVCDGIDNDCDGSTDEGAAAYCQVEVENAIAGCKAGRCSVFACQAGYADANGDPGDGCEVPFEPVISNIPCAGDYDCDDGNLCNGFERCLPPAAPGANRFCASGSPIDCGTSSGGTLDGDVIIQTSQDIRSLANIDTITGDLVIENTSLSSLVGLESLQVIGGNLSIQNNTQLTKLSGSALSNLETVGGVITVRNNAALTSADLPSLRRAKGLYIQDNATLKELIGYSGLTSIEELHIERNGQLASIQAFKNLTRIGGLGKPFCPDGCYVCRAGGLAIDGYESPITDVSGLDGLTEVGGDLCLTDVASPVLGFPNLKTVGMTLRVNVAYFPQTPDDTTGAAESLSFPELVSVGTLGTGALEPPESAIQGVGSLLLNLRSPALTSISLPKLKTVGDVFDLYEDASNLTELELGTLQTVGSFQGTAAVAQLKTLPFPALQEARVFNLTLGISANLPAPPKLETIDLSRLTTAPYVTMSANQTLPVLRDVNLSRLQTATNGIQISLPFVPPSGAPGLNLGSLTPRGDTITGGVRLCTGVYNSQLATYDNAACGLIDSLVASGYAGTPDTCDQCVIP